MKTLATLLILISLSFASCSKSDDSLPNAADTSSQKNEILGKTWTISSYIDKGKDETYHFSGYSFTFGENGIFTATVSGTNFTGSWNISSNQSGFDDSGNHSGNSNKFIITATGNDQMDELSDDFMIVSISSTEIILKDDNPTKVKELKFSRK
jgi:hypothetical protein